MEIESNMEEWKDCCPTHRKYILGRSCIYESSPSEGDCLPRLTVRIFIHEIRSGEEIRTGEISVYVGRDRWNEIGNLNNADEADKQLKKAANSTREGDWNLNPLPELLRKGCEIIPSQISRYECDESLISGKYSI